MRYWVINGKLIAAGNESVAIRTWKKLERVSTIKVKESIEMTRISPDKYEELQSKLKAGE